MLKSKIDECFLVHLTNQMKPTVCCGKIALMIRNIQMFFCLKSNPSSLYLEYWSVSEKIGLAWILMKNEDKRFEDYFKEHWQIMCKLLLFSSVSGVKLAPTEYVKLIRQIAMIHMRYSLFPIIFEVALKSNDASGNDLTN